jgi:quercetin 2,3-dioxygenase
MTIQRKIEQVDTVQGQPGFLGRGHTAYPVIQRHFSESDPFIMLMDDVLDKKDNQPVGGPHPHGGFETVTLVLEGELGELREGDFQLMTAGSGIIHTETIDKKMKMRILQLWLSLPNQLRWTSPRLQELRSASAPSSLHDGVHIRLYSGSLQGLVSPVQNHTPLLLADINMEAGATTRLTLPVNYTGFLYMIKGTVNAGEEQTPIVINQVGWLNRHNKEELSELLLTSGPEGGRLILYAAQPTGDAIVSYGPFIADNTENIKRLYREFQEGRMQHIDAVDEKQRIMYQL